MVIEVLNCIFSGIIAISSIIALIIGGICFNKRLKIYFYKEQNILKIHVFSKENEKCGICNITYYTKKDQQTTVRPCSKNEFSIDLSNIASPSILHIIFIDNYGRKYIKRVKI